MERNEKHMKKKIESLMDKFQKDLKKDLDSLKQKIDINRNELLIQKQNDYDNMVKKYKANRSTVESKINLARAQKLKFL